MSLESALIKSKEEVWSIAEIGTYLDFPEIKDDLYCSTPNCPARLVYVRHNNPYLRIAPNDNHSEECDDVFVRSALRRRKEKIDTLDAELDENDFSSRHSYYLKKYLEENSDDKSNQSNKNPKKKRKKPNPINNIDPPESYIETKLSTDGTGETIDELKSRGIVAKSPRIPEKKLHQLTLSDLGTLAGTILKVESFKKLAEKNYKMMVSSSGKSAVLTLPESFFATQYIEAETYIKSINDYLEDKVNGKIPFDLFLSTNFSIAKISDDEIELNVLQYKWLSIVVMNRAPKKMKLPEFYANYTRGNYSI